MKDQQKLQNIAQQFSRVINKYNAWEKIPRKYGTEELLYRAEIHTIEAIGLKQRVNVTELAQYLGITKGAVSQMIDKLVKKGFVNKQMIPTGENEVTLELTEKGMQAYQGHSNYHSELYERITSQVDDVMEAQLEGFSGILDMIEQFIDKKKSK
ncbi:MAG: MarR family transcriptional regulator [Clostridia bacterium]|nr:MarR family transcriptional regulator [Clostridia bacterium]